MAFQGRSLGFEGGTGAKAWGRFGRASLRADGEPGAESRDAEASRKSGVRVASRVPFRVTGAGMRGSGETDQSQESEIGRPAAGWVLTLLLCPDQCTMAWLWAESPVSAKEVLGSRSSSAAKPPARGAFTSSREPLARGRLPLEPSAGAVAQVSPSSGALGG
ncbi:hypothetical protein P7K49_024412 [Saguinus oedipus]|uniref:Uncharacterized protein n=1 Tax=Saguinus oedipus TaxID=9490 RepID=A0ABQ9UQ57_SAGOE|nr:hypothetical protein P7K49_024412 [Saguinus oedipus]